MTIIWSCTLVQEILESRFWESTEHRQPVSPLMKYRVMFLIGTYTMHNLQQGWQGMGNMEEIIGNIQDSVVVYKTIKPVYNFKSSEVE